MLTTSQMAFYHKILHSFLFLLTIICFFNSPAIAITMYTCSYDNKTIYQPFPCKNNQNILSIEQLEQIRNQSLIELTKRGDEFKVQELLQQDVSVNATDNNNRTSLFYALEHRHYNLAKLLIMAGGMVNQSLSDNSGHNLLLYFTEQQNISAVEILLTANAETNIMDYTGKTPLIIALEKKSLPLIKLLLKHNADINFLSNNNIDNFSITPLIFFAANDDLELTNLLINLGAKINLTNNQDISPLIAAALSNNIEIVDILLKSGADPNPLLKNSQLWELVKENRNSEIITLISKNKYDSKNFRN